MFASLFRCFSTPTRRRPVSDFSSLNAADILESRLLLSAAPHKVAPASFAGHWQVHNGNVDEFVLTISQNGRRISADSDVDILDSPVRHLTGKVKGDHLVLRGRGTNANGSKYQVKLEADKTSNIHFEGHMLVAIKNGSAGSYNADGELVIPI